MKPSQLTHRREKMGLSQRELAQEFGVSQAAVSRWEAGKRKIPGWVPKLLRFIEASKGK